MSYRHAFPSDAPQEPLERFGGNVTRLGVSERGQRPTRRLAQT